MRNPKYMFAKAGDLAPLRKLLNRCDLPLEGIEDALSNCMVAKAGSKVVGMAAIETYGSYGLLRSVAVAPGERGKQIGEALCRKIITHGQILRVRKLYLLTVTAPGYFERLGFKRIPRAKVPREIQASLEFSSLCPVTAVCMVLELAPRVVHAEKDVLRLKPDVPGARMWAISLAKTMLTYFEVDPRSRFETHSHKSEQITLVLTGELFFEVSGRVYRVTPGEVIAVPSGIPHAVWTEDLAVTAVDAWSPIMEKY